MPLHFESALTNDTCLAVWHISEDEAFFRSHAVPQRDVSHPHKRLQHLAGRFLLRHLFTDFPTELIRVADTRKPFLEDEAFHFSISHCSDFAAAIASRTRRVGVDIEVITEKAVRIRHKFASEEEWGMVSDGVLRQSPNDGRWSTVDGRSVGKPGGSDALYATLIWSVKEAVFKWYGSGEVDFTDHIQIVACQWTGTGKVEVSICFQKQEPVELRVFSRMLGGLWLSYVVA